MKISGQSLLRRDVLRIGTLSLVGLPFVPGCGVTTEQIRLRDRRHEVENQEAALTEVFGKRAFYIFKALKNLDDRFFTNQHSRLRSVRDNLKEEMENPLSFFFGDKHWYKEVISFTEKTQEHLLSRFGEAQKSERKRHRDNLQGLFNNSNTAMSLIETVLKDKPASISQDPVDEQFYVEIYAQVRIILEMMRPYIDEIEKFNKEIKEYNKKSVPYGATTLPLYDAHFGFSIERLNDLEKRFSKLHGEDSVITQRAQEILNPVRKENSTSSSEYQYDKHGEIKKVPDTELYK